MIQSAALRAAVMHIRETKRSKGNERENMPNYANSKIYKLVSFNLPELPYYGSTTQTLCKRKGRHVSDYKANGLKASCTSRIVIDAGDYEIIWVEDFPCENKDQLRARERYYIENRVCVNKNVPGRTTEEWYQANKVHVKAYQNEWQQANPMYHKEWHQANPMYNKEYYHANLVHMKAYQKEWHQANPAYKKDYYKVNGAVQRARQSERIQCTVCNCMTSRGNCAQHQRSAKCKRAGLLIGGIIGGVGNL
jgi:hypothetical protein